MKSTTKAIEENQEIQKQLQSRSKYNNNKCFSWISAVFIISLTVSHSLLEVFLNDVKLRDTEMLKSQLAIDNCFFWCS